MITERTMVYCRPTGTVSTIIIDINEAKPSMVHGQDKRTEIVPMSQIKISDLPWESASKMMSFYVGLKTGFDIGGKIRNGLSEFSWVIEQVLYKNMKSRRFFAPVF